MNHMKSKIGEELKKELEKGYNIKKISNWADDAMLSLRGENLEIHDILDRISLMGAGPEFEYTKEELNLLAELLINEEKNPIKQIDDLCRD